MTMITANSHQYSDQGEASRDMRNHGWELWLLPMLSDVMFEVQNASTYASSALTQANNAAASATLAQNYAAALRGTSTTSNTISSGTKNWTTQTGKQWAAGQWVLIADAANPTVNYLNSQVVSYNSGTGALQTTTAVTGANGSGTLTSWTINVSGPNGAQGSTGASGSQDLTRSARSTSGSIVPLDKATIIEASGTITLTFNAPGTLTNKWWCEIVNAGTGLVTVAHTSGNVDGVASYVLYPGAHRRFQCDGTTITSRIFAGATVKFLTSTTHSMPPGVKGLRLIGLGAGGGGASGCLYNTSGSNIAPGSGGGGGELLDVILPNVPSVGTSTSVTIGTGGTGGAFQITSGNGGLAGSSGGNTSFGTLFKALGGDGAAAGSVFATGAPGKGGSLGTVSSVVGPGQATSNQGSDRAGATGGTGVAGDVGTDGGRSAMGGSAGGGGGGVSSGNSGRPGGAGGASGRNVSATTWIGLGPTAGTGGNTSGAGGNGNNASTARLDSYGQDGGSGGGGSYNNNGGNGGNGGLGGGGGGGGASNAGSGFRSGAGGNGGDGMLILMELI